MSSVYANRLTLSIFGQSHGPAVGMTLDGLPPGETVDLDRLQGFLARRAPGSSPWSTPRREGDVPELLSGLAGGKTCGAPLSAIIRNENARPEDYTAALPRPGHADFTAQMKFSGAQDASGGGHFSGRLTAPLCVAGGVCLQILERRGIRIAAHIARIAAVSDRLFDPAAVDTGEFDRLYGMDFPVLDADAGAAMRAAIAQARAEGDSVGGVVECAAVGLPPGLGDPIFGGMENRLAQLIFGIPAVKGLEFGAGFAAADMRGSAHNDPFVVQGGKIRTSTNHHGGILGGITSGMPLLLRAAFKPTPSIAIAQRSVEFAALREKTLEIKGRHDPCIVPRAVPCIEAAAAVAVLDALLEQGAYEYWKEERHHEHENTAQ